MKLVISWPRFGPYHLARLNACARTLGPRGVTVIGLETAARETLNAWEVRDEPDEFVRHQVFPNRVFEDIPPREMERGIAQALDRLQPDALAVMSYGYPDARAALAWGRRHRRVVVNLTDTKEDDGPRVAWWEWLKRQIVGEFDAALVGGTPQRRYLAKLGFSDRFIFEPANTVDNKFYCERAQTAREDPTSVAHLPGLQDEIPFFLAAGRFIRVKNLDGLLSAYCTYREHSSHPWRLLLVGDGPERAAIEAQIRRAEINGVELCGYQTSDALAAYLGRASALVLPSHKDTWGLVVNEAMSAGLPVIVSRQCGCWMDLVDEGRSGFTFDSTDMATLAALLARTSAPDTDRAAMGERAREIIASYTPEHFAESLYTAVLAGRLRANRPPAVLATSALMLMRNLARSVTGFHRTEV